MTEPLADFVSDISTIVDAHYQRDFTPLLLSKLGSILRKDDKWPTDAIGNRSLREIIEQAAHPNLIIVQDENNLARIAVANSNSKPLVENWMAKLRVISSDVPDLDALPRSVVLAFCQDPQTLAPVYLSRTSPFKYHIDIPLGEDASGYFRVDARYRRAVKVSQLDEMDAKDRLDLQTRIARWCLDSGVEIQKLYKSGQDQRSNALIRLIAAQLPSVAKQMLIPADIALILSGHE